MTTIGRPYKSTGKTEKYQGERRWSQDLAEVELEVDTKLFSGYDLFKTGADTIRFEELIEIYLNNAGTNNRVPRY